MSDRTRIIKRVLGAAVIALGCIAIAATGHPFDAAAEDPDEKAVRKAYKDYIKANKDIEKQFRGSDTFQIDEAHKVGAYDLIIAFQNNAGRSPLSTSGTGRRGYPRFNGFDDPDTRIGIDNPDTQYMSTVVYNASGDNIYRVFGNRSNTADFILTLFDTLQGAGGLGTLEDEDMVINPDGSYEAYFSTAALRDPAWDNWAEIPAQDGIQIARRNSACDWTTEVPGEVHVERIGTAGVPSGAPDLTILEAQYQDAIQLLNTQAPFWPAFADTIKSQIPVNTATPWVPTANLGITTQANMTMWYELADDEALIIRLPDVGLAAYYGIQVFNFWGSSADWANRQASLSWGLGGSCQAELSQPTFHPAQQFIIDNGGAFCGQQDAYFAVLSKNDPGVQNWLDTSDLTQGAIAARQQSVPSADLPQILGLASCSLPVAIKVPLAFVKPTLTQLGASFTNYTAADRAGQLEVRQNYARDKYVFW